MDTVDDWFVNALAHGVVAFALDNGEIVAANDAFRALLSREDQQLSGTSISRVSAESTGESSEKTLLEYANRVRTANPVEFTWLFEASNGAFVPTVVTLTVRSREGRSIAIMSVRKGNAETLSEPSIEHSDTDRGPESDTRHRSVDEATSVRYERMLERSTDYVVIVDETGEITDCSPGIELALGYTPEHLIGTDAFTYVHPEDRGRVQEAFTTKLENPGDQVTVTYRTVASDGTVLWTEARGTNQLADPVIEGILVTIRDVTDRESYRRRLETQTRLLERLVEVLSRDLKTPVSTATKLLALLRTDLERPPERARDSLERLDTVVDDLRTFAEYVRTVARQGTPVETPLAFDGEEVIRSAWRDIDTGTLELTVEGERTLSGDPKRVRHLFRVLFETIVAHTDGATTVTVDITTSAVVVGDDGTRPTAEIPEEPLDYRSMTAGDTDPGLVVARTIVEAHGWEIDAAKTEGSGARFVVRTVPERIA